MDDSQNLVEIKIINSYSDVRKIGVRAGGILSVVGDVRIYEVEYEIADFLFASQNVTFGYFDGTSLVSVDINHAVNNPDFSTYDNSLDFYDVNSVYTSFEYLLSVNLGTEYLYASYDWSGANYSGLTNDLFILLEDADLLSVTDIKLLYDSDKIAIKVIYSDDSFELLDNSNPLLSAEVLALGSGRFYLRANLDDTKLIKEVEVRFSPFVNAVSELKLYSVFLRNAGTSTPLPVEFLGLDVTVFETDVDITWTTLSELNNDYFKLIQRNELYEIVDEFIIEGKVNSVNLEEYFMTRSGLQKGVHYFSLYQYDIDGNEEYLETEAVLIDAEVELSIFPNPTNNTLFIQKENNKEEYTFELVDTDKSTFKKVMSYGTNDLSDEIPGTYYLKILSEESVAYQKIIIVD